jgi:hypothetical protein
MKTSSEYKYVNATFAKLSEFKIRNTFKVKSADKYFNNIELDIWFKENKFHFYLDASNEDCFASIYKNIDKLFNSDTVQNGQDSFSFLKYASDNINIGLASQIFEGELNSMIQDNLSEYNSEYLRFLIPFEKQAKVGAIEKYKDLNTDQKVMYGVGFNSFHIAGLDIHVCRVSEGDIKYLMIDVLNKEDIKIIDKRIDALLIALSYLYGTGFKSECYFVSSRDTSFQTINRVGFYTREKNYNHTSPIYDSMEIREYKFTKDYYILPQTVLINLCEKIIKKEKFLRAIEIYIEAVQNKYSLSKCVLLSTCLETIVGLVKLDSKTNPIELERFNESDILSKLVKVVNETEHLTKADKEFLIEKKLQYINSPTNPDKIGLSISKYNIKLPEKFKKALKYRNLYLHGSIPKGNLLGSVNNDNFLRAFELQFLVNILILKMVGYCGFLKNYSAEMEYYTKKENNHEDLIIDHSLYYKI